MNKTLTKEQIKKIATDITGMPAEQILDIHMRPTLITVLCLVPAEPSDEGNKWMHDGVSYVKEVRKIKVIS